MIELDNGDAYVSLAEAAELLGVQSLAAMRSRGRFIPSAGDLGPRAPAFLRSDVLAYGEERGRKGRVQDVAGVPKGATSCTPPKPVDNFRGGVVSDEPPPVRLKDSPRGQNVSAELEGDAGTAAEGLALVRSALPRLRGPLRRDAAALLRTPPASVSGAALSAVLMPAADSVAPSLSARIVRFLEGS